MGSNHALHCRFLPLLVALLFFDCFTAFRNSNHLYILVFLLRRFNIHFVFDPMRAFDVAERIRRSIENYHFDSVGNVTVSIGVWH